MESARTKRCKKSKIIKIHNNTALVCPKTLSMRYKVLIKVLFVSDVRLRKSKCAKLYRFSPLFKRVSTYESDSIVIVNNVIKSSAVLKIVCKSHNKM